MEARILPARDDTWRDVVLRNVRHGRLVMTFANEGYSLFLHNWVESLRALRLDEFVVVALDPPVAAQLARRGLARHTIDGGAQTRREARAVRPTGRLKAVSWYDPAYRQLMGSQPSRVLRVMEAGAFDLLVTDVDVLWRASPWPVLLSPARRRCEVQAIQAHAAREGARNASEQPVVVREPHPQANCASCINAGFLFLRRGSPSAMELAVNNVDHNQKWLNWFKPFRYLRRHFVPARVLVTEAATRARRACDDPCRMCESHMSILLCPYHTRSV
ncbi:hypothetical protein AB1Y20_000842 [Prymnesium parvum]|uniref:Nucleotide-diphospho-sugar transferase domain-containing protein n=1 Tax=Prymnesium parvum TaxID=97485 RepID=A0AB34KBK3_PRYPA